MKFSFQTQQGISITRTTKTLDYKNAIEPLIDALDTQRGVLMASSFEYPGRYTRWDIGFINPPLQIIACGRSFAIEALNDRGKILLQMISPTVTALAALTQITVGETAITGSIKQVEQRMAEELRSKQPSVFSLLRAINELFAVHEDSHLGWYGAFGYDLAFQFEPINLQIPRDSEQRDLVLYLPDEIYIVDHRREVAARYSYEFCHEVYDTQGLPRTGAQKNYIPASKVTKTRDHQAGEYAACVHLAQAAFKRGDLFEVVPGQTFYDPCSAHPSEIFRRLQTRNPSPYGFFLNLGAAEYLVGASPEMYVRVTGRRVETCPISGTIARGQDAIGDAAQILKLLNSKKEAAELTMCTDVDRNDKSRICEPGSVRVIGRRMIELYSRLIHTVDHVEGVLRAGYDALDAFLTHTWAVTVTGAPKAWAMQFLEDHERSPRHWYGGAVGMIGFNGDMNTGLTLRTIRIKNGVAEVRVGATLLYDSIPEEEEKETELKAAALWNAIREALTTIPTSHAVISTVANKGQGKKVLLVDHQDSFVHTLANYLRQTGAEIITWRTGFNADELRALAPDLLVLSPGPGCPKDFKVADTLAMAQAQNIPVFGVCLGLQGMVEYFGGRLGVLDYPMHGKPTMIKVSGESLLFANIPKQFVAGLYHSLYAEKTSLPTQLRVTAESSDGVIMALEHIELPMWAVQFHPESLLSLENNIGLRIMENVMGLVASRLT